MNIIFIVGCVDSVSLYPNLGFEVESFFPHPGLDGYSIHVFYLVSFFQLLARYVGVL